MAYCAAVGDILDVSALVTNTGEADGDQDIIFLRGEAQFGSVNNVVLSEDQEQSVSSTLDTSSLSPGTYTIKVKSDNNSDVFEFDLVDPTNTAFYLVNIDSTNEPVQPGETFEITATIRNVGDQDGTQDIVFSTNGTTRDTISGKQITAGSQDTVTLSWSVTQSDVGDYTANVSTADCEDTQDIVIGSDAYFDVEITSTNSPVNEGENLIVDINATNTGNTAESQDITLDVGGTQRDAWPGFYLESGQSLDLQLDWDTQDGDAGDYTATVESQDGSDTASVTIDPENPSGDTILSGDIDGQYHAIDDSNGGAFYTGSDTGSVGAIEAFATFDKYYTGEGDGDIYERNPSDGSVSQSNLGAGGAAFNNSTADDTYIYFRNTNGIYKIDPSDLSVLWQSNAVTDGSPGLTNDNSYIYAVDGTTAYKISKGDGSTVESNSVGSNDLFGITIGDNGLYAVGFNELVRLDPSDLSVNYTNSSVAGKSMTQSGSSVYNGGESDTGLQKIDPSDGSVIWTVGLNDECVAAEAKADDTKVYCGTDNANIQKVDAASQSVDWTYNMNSFSMFGGLEIGGTI